MAAGREIGMSEPGALPASNVGQRRANKPRRAAKRRPGAGRPTREQAELRHEELLDRALDLFLRKGFEVTTIEAIAASLGMAKRSVYARYQSKAALFRAAVQRAIEQWIVPIEALRKAESDDLEATLTAVARIRMANALSPAGLRLQRIINTESYRFPEIFTLAFEQGTRPTIDYLTDLLQRHADLDRVSVTQPRTAATVFLSMVVGGPLRAVVWGKAVDPDGFEERIRFCVRLFLDGVRPR
jgi:TetR/AcrR family transcriptional regulator, mexJK operon transcriptional repressor